MTTPLSSPQVDSRLAPSSQRRWGIFTLANDAVAESFLALAGSLSEFAPDLPLAVIPFDDRQERLSVLVERLGASYCVPDEIDALDRLGERFYRHELFHARGFRKIAAFHGPFERFLFLDTDVVALAPLAELCAAIEGADPPLVYFDVDLDQVYRHGLMRTQISTCCAARGFNAGLFAARRTAMTAKIFESSLVDLGSDWRDHLVPHAEQPFLNLAFDRAGHVPVGAHELLPSFCSTCWAKLGTIEDYGTGYRLSCPSRWDHGRRILFAHWAGVSLSPTMPNRHLHDRYLETAKTLVTDGPRRSRRSISND